MKKYAVSLAVSAVAFSMFGAGCLTLGPRIVKAPEAPSPVAEAPSAARPSVVAYLKLNGGAATVQRKDRSAAAKENTELASGDRVVVTGGTISLVYPAAGETRLDAGSQVMIVSQPGSGGLAAQLRLTAGNAWTRFERLLGADEQFSVAANGVVATVRGTAFGVSIAGSDVDVQVADHDVAVAEESAPTVKTTIAAGEGVTVHAQAFTKRTLTDAERAAPGYRFALQPISADRLAAPANPVTLFPQSGFSAPTRAVTNPEAAPTNVAPTVKGPTAQ